VVLSTEIVATLFEEVAKTSGYTLSISLEQQTVTTPSKKVYSFEMDKAVKEKLLHGLDDIGLTLKMADKITAYEKNRADKEPWVFDLK
jgi:3-isopropylmalate/(R)-2-methylmalate dehydratase small subunit